MLVSYIFAHELAHWGDRQNGRLRGEGPGTAFDRMLFGARAPGSYW